MVYSIRTPMKARYESIQRRRAARRRFQAAVRKAVRNARFAKMKQYRAVQRLASRPVPAKKFNRLFNRM